MIYQHFPPPEPGYLFPSHLFRILMLPSVRDGLRLDSSTCGLLVDIAFQCLVDEYFFEILRENQELIQS
jgi:hypothetical protein